MDMPMMFFYASCSDFGKLKKGISISFEKEGWKSW
jgi:hypothetical protein